LDVSLIEGVQVPDVTAWLAAQPALEHPDYEDLETTWLRWATPDGTLIPTGAESARAARSEADAARNEADAARTRADRMAARLRALGIDPDAL